MKPSFVLLLLFSTFFLLFSFSFHYEKQKKDKEGGSERERKRNRFLSWRKRKKKESRKRKKKKEDDPDFSPHRLITSQGQARVWNNECNNNLSWLSRLSVLLPFSLLLFSLPFYFFVIRKSWTKKEIEKVGRQETRNKYQKKKKNQEFNCGWV